MLEPKGKVPIEAYLYPMFNTRTLRGSFDGKPYRPGVNVLGPPIPQYRWDADNDRNFPEPAFVIEPGGRLVVAKQEQFYEAIFESPEVFFGGAAGGGKSVALMKSHAVKHLSWAARGIKGQTTAMFCETKEELLRRHIVHLPKHLPKWLGWYDAENFIWHFWPKYGGGMIMFLYIGRKKTDIERILSYEFAYITIDELTRNQKQVYDFISSRLRSVQVPPEEWCLASASNPGSVGHKWVYGHFVNTRERKQAAKNGEQRTFIQALASDNPHLPKEYYEKQLAKLPEKYRKAYRDGNWKVFEGQFFDMLDETVHLLPKFRVTDEVSKYMGIDIGLSHPTGCVWLMHFPGTEEHPRGRLVVYRYYEAKHKSGSKHKKEICDRMKHDKNVMSPVPLSHDAWNTRGSTEGDLTVSERFNTDDEWGPNLNVVQSGRDRKGRWRLLLDLLYFESHMEVDENGNMIRVIDRSPTLYFMDTPDVRMLFDELAALVHKEGDSEDCQPLGKSEYEVGFGDEGPDALGYCVEGMDSGILMDYAKEEEPYNPYGRDVLQPQKEQIGYASFYA